MSLFTNIGEHKFWEHLFPKFLRFPFFDSHRYPNNYVPHSKLLTPAYILFVIMFISPHLQQPFVWKTSTKLSRETEEVPVYWLDTG
jgi:hypothetical protein